MRRTSFAEFRCSLSRSLDLIGPWWTMLIIRDLYLGLRRFDDLATDLGISRNLLASRLEDLVAGGIVTRQQYADRPPRYEYLLTEAGGDLIPVVLALTAWGDRWTATDEGAPVVLEHECGDEFVPEVHCSACAGEIRADNVTVRPGPGGGPGPGTWLIAERLAAQAR